MYNELPRRLVKHIRERGNMQLVLKADSYGIPGKFDTTPFRYVYVDKVRNSRADLFEFYLTEFRTAFSLAEFRLSSNISNENALPQIEMFLHLAMEDAVKHALSLEKKGIIVSTHMPLLVSVMAERLFKIEKLRECDPSKWRGIWTDEGVCKRRKEIEEYEKSKFVAATRIVH